VINSNLDPIFYLFSLKLSIENCVQIVVLQAIGNCQRAIRWYHRRPSMTYRLATIRTIGIP